MKRMNAWLACLLAPACGEVTIDQEIPMEIGEKGQAIDSSRNFGAFCQADYQNNWQDLLEWEWSICNGLVNDLDDTNALVFQWNMVGAKPFFEDSCDGCAGGADQVDLMFSAGHGGAFSHASSLVMGAPSITATQPMWNVEQRAFTASMRLGDDARGLSIYSSYVCFTHNGSFGDNDPGNVGTAYGDRWFGVFRGGLRIATSTIDDAMSGESYRNVGKRYSDNLQAGQTFFSAWSNALNINNTNDPSIIASGTTELDCVNRRNTMSWNNFRNPSYPKLQDGNVGWLCRFAWTNI